MSTRRPLTLGLAVLALAVATLVLASTRCVAASLDTRYEVIVGSDGSALVKIFITYEGDAPYLTLLPPGHPDLLITYLSNGTLLDHKLYENGTLLIMVPQSYKGTIIVEYVTQSLTEKHEALWMFSISVNASLRVKMPENAVILDVSRLPDDVRLEDHSIILDYSVGGGVEVVYTILATVSPIPSPTPSNAEPASTPPTTPKTTTSEAPQGILINVNPWLIPIAGLGVVAVIVVLSRSRGGVEMVEAGTLDEIDRKILELVRTKGVIKQSEVQKKLGIPKASLSRRVKRLAGMGYISVERRGRHNLLKPGKRGKLY